MIDEKLKKFKPSALASAEFTPKLSSMPKNKTSTPESAQQKTVLKDKSMESMKLHSPSKDIGQEPSLEKS